MDNVECIGNEGRLIDCSFSGWDQHSCSSHDAAGVICDCPNNNHRRGKRYIGWPKQSPMRVRLAGGRNSNEGRVEVNLSDGQGWGTICAAEWTYREGNVVCRQLGLGYAARANLTLFFGTAPRILYGTKCRGTEANLSQCRHQESLPRNCQLNNGAVAGVKCDHRSPDLILEMDVLQHSARLQTRTMGELECAMEENCVSKQAYAIREENPDTWRNITRKLLRFTTKATNIGTADFSPYANRDSWIWHECHKLDS